jgi:hypothetical protein
MAVARQWIGKHFSAATNTQSAIEELLDVVFSMNSVTYQILSMQWKKSRRLVLLRRTFFNSLKSGNSDFHLNWAIVPSASLKAINELPYSSVSQTVHLILVKFSMIDLCISLIGLLTYFKVYFTRNNTLASQCSPSHKPRFIILLKIDMRGFY